MTHLQSPMTSKLHSPPDTTPLVVLGNANPFKLKQGFKPFKIDWGKSTLDIDATVASMKEHKDKLSDPIKHAKYTWPYFIAMKLLGKDYILKDDELIKLLYTHFPTYDHPAELKGQQLVEAFKNNDSTPQYFHRTKKFNGALIPMLKSGFIEPTKNPKPGAFFGLGTPASKSMYGQYMLCLKDLEYDDIPITHYTHDTGFYYPGFFHKIDLKKHLSYISLPDKEIGNIGKVKKALKDNGYKGVGVYTEKKMRNSVYKNKISIPAIVPKFWPSTKTKGLTYYAKKDGELIATRYGQHHPKELYRESSIKFASFSH